MLIWSIRLCFRWRFLFKLKKTYNNIFSIYYRLSEFRPYNWFFNRDREKTVKLLPSSSKSVYQIVALALEEGRRSEMWICAMLCLEIRIMKSWCASQSDSSLSLITHSSWELGPAATVNTSPPSYFTAGRVLDTQLLLWAGLAALLTWLTNM